VDVLTGAVIPSCSCGLSIPSLIPGQLTISSDSVPDELENACGQWDYSESERIYSAGRLAEASGRTKAQHPLHQSSFPDCMQSLMQQAVQLQAPVSARGSNEGQEEESLIERV